MNLWRFLALRKSSECVKDEVSDLSRPENAESNVFCNNCGSKLPTANANQPVAPNQPAASVDEGVKAVVVKRFDAIKDKDEAAVSALMDEGYDKFDDWAPLQRQTRAEALNNEFSAFKVMSSYTYELKDLKTTVLGDAAGHHLHSALHSKHAKPAVRRNLPRHHHPQKTGRNMENHPRTPLKIPTRRTRKPAITKARKRIRISILTRTLKVYYCIRNVYVRWS